MPLHIKHYFLPTSLPICSLNFKSVNHKAHSVEKYQAKDVDIRDAIQIASGIFKVTLDCISFIKSGVFRIQTQFYSHHV